MDREKIENNRETIEKDRLENISRKILVMARNELYMKMRFLDVALSSLPFVLDTGRKVWEQTDCICIMIHNISGIVQGRPSDGEQDLPASGAAWDFSPYDPQKRKRGTALSSVM